MASLLFTPSGYTISGVLPLNHREGARWQTVIVKPKGSQHCDKGTVEHGVADRLVVKTICRLYGLCQHLTTRITACSVHIVDPEFVRAGLLQECGLGVWPGLG